MNKKTRAPIRRGSCYPLGATPTADGVNFSIYSKNATRIDLQLFKHADSGKPYRTIKLRRSRNRTFHYWHVFVPGLEEGQLYGYRIHGPFNPGHGHRFQAEKLLTDPYGRCVSVPSSFSRNRAKQPGDNAKFAMKSVVADLSSYDWEGDKPLRRPYTQTVIYELHVGGFTQHASSGLSREIRGTYAGLIEKIPYLKDLGITAVELMPVFQFDEQDAPDGLTNYWGYSPISFFAPHCGYSSNQEPLGPINEFRDMVKALHRAGIEVILDVVYNHTAEGDQDGPTYNFKGIENGTYYILGQAPTEYANYSGTGNTLNASNTIVRRMILDSLHYWVEEMHVDGFRFDLASILSRSEEGEPLATPPTLWDIESDPRLASTKLIAEAWDAAGLYQVGSFIGDRWNEWNGKFRDDIRRFVRGDEGMVSKIPARLLASPDLFGHEEREPEQSINFITCHDGFTLNDLVSYNQKHNEANKEDNRDGHDHNLSWNCGLEGISKDPTIEEIRTRQIKNFLTINLMSLGTPMLLMGDEFRRTQLGNNNAYCQDNEISWMNWTNLDKYPDIHRFLQRLISIRLTLDVLRGDQQVSLSEFLKRASINWHGVNLYEPDWGYQSRSLALTINCVRRTCRFHFMLNSYWKALKFEIPTVKAEKWRRWRRMIDTSLTMPDDICEPERGPIINDNRYAVEARSIVVLVANGENK